MSVQRLPLVGRRPIRRQPTADQSPDSAAAATGVPSHVAMGLPF
jgi:hypothetical protein